MKITKLSPTGRITDVSPLVPGLKRYEAPGEPSKLLVEIDFTEAEKRVMAHIAQDPDGLDKLKNWLL